MIMLRSVSFHVVGVSHHTSGIELRERLAFSSAEAAAWLQGQAAAGSVALFGSDDLEVIYLHLQSLRDLLER